MKSGHRAPDSDARQLIEQAARSFDNELRTPSYRAVHSDEGQLGWMVSALQAAASTPGAVLDVGTGNGYVAMEVAERCPGTHTIGVDIAVETIEKNRSDAARRGLSNTEFSICDGITLPFPDEHFGGVTSRYAFHHFPRPGTTLAEVHRVLLPGRPFVLADAVRHEQDDVDFLNAFQKLKPDGHVEMLRAKELVSLVKHHGFRLRQSLATSLTFERAASEACLALIRSTPPRVLAAYDLHRDGDFTRLTLPIFSAIFLRLATDRAGHTRASPG